MENKQQTSATTDQQRKKRKVSDAAYTEVNSMPARSWSWHIRNAFKSLWYATKKRPIITPLLLIFLSVVVSAVVMEGVIRGLQFLINLTR